MHTLIEWWRVWYQCRKKKHEQKRMLALWSTGLYTLNEIRTKHGLPPLGERTPIELLHKDDPQHRHS